MSWVGLEREKRCLIIYRLKVKIVWGSTFSHDILPFSWVILYDFNFFLTKKESQKGRPKYTDDQLTKLNSSQVLWIV